MAETGSPLRSRVSSPNWAGVRPEASIFSTARSSKGSKPTNWADQSESSERVTLTCSAPAMIWALVTIYPSAVSTIPVPVETIPALYAVKAAMEGAAFS